MSAAEHLLRCTSESPTEDTSYAGLATDIEMEAEARVRVSAASDEEESGASSNEDSSADLTSCSSHNATGVEDESDGDMLLQYTHDASVASDKSFPDDNAWNRYNEDEELDAEFRFREFEELLDSESDLDGERKLQYISTATTINKFQMRK